MSKPGANRLASDVHRYPIVPHVAMSIVVGFVFVGAVLLAAMLPALAVVYLVVGFTIRNVVVILVLWAASATLTIILYQVISRTYIRAILRRRVLPILPGVSAEPK